MAQAGATFINLGTIPERKKKTKKLDKYIKTIFNDHLYYVITCIM